MSSICRSISLKFNTIDCSNDDANTYITTKEAFISYASWVLSFQQTTAEMAWVFTLENYSHVCSHVPN